MLRFNPKNHTYKLNGKSLPSVTQLIEEYMGSDYSNVPKYIIEQAGAFGTTIHNAIEMFERIGLLRDDLDDKQSKCLNDYLMLREEGYLSHETASIHGIENMLHYKEVYAGTADLIFKSPWGYGIIDYKTSSKPYIDKWTLQLNLYRKAFEWSTGEEVKVMQVYHLKKRGKSKIIDIEKLEDEELNKVIHEF